ncbi:hypothetical protein J6TS2_03320 [Heyndrickxia sporothermodurans]|nr:hypothetical protein J6TS2_03320 [Heyndrickxia sporothermodurans]
MLNISETEHTTEDSSNIYLDETYSICPNCDGYGFEIDASICDYCYGVGRVK